MPLRRRGLECCSCVISFSVENSEELVELNHHRLGAGYVRARVIVTMLLLFAGIGVLLRLDADGKRRQAGVQPASTNLANRATQANLRQIQLAYGHAPIMFEPNVGQTDSAV